jgi:hypothetical protein
MAYKIHKNFQPMSAVDKIQIQVQLQCLVSFHCITFHDLKKKIDFWFWHIYTINFSFFFLFPGVGDQTKDLMCARQVLYH